MRQVAVLFARSDSVYKALAGTDVWDIERDARRWPGGEPVVAHPPCRAWGRLRHLAKPRPDEKALALWAVKQVQTWGGVLEHPAASTLWAAAGLPAPGRFDAVGGWTLPVHQHWWGHRATKATLLYIVGIAPRDLPELPMRLGEGTHVISQDGRRKDGTRLPKGDPRKRPECTKSEREHTPPALAEWLLELARRTKKNTQGDQPRYERGREVMEPEACESAAGRGADGAPALATLPHYSSPVGGPMGAWQPAAAGPPIGQGAA